MRAAGLFAGHRDAEALLASTGPRESRSGIEYYDDELDGECRLQDIVFGNYGTLRRWATMRR